jgi:hypothetical protein
MPNIDLSILNQRQTPAFFADTLANRPAAGFLGRIFVSTDTFEFYRDNGTGWNIIGGPGTGTITGSGAAGQVSYFSGASSIAGSNDLFFDSVNGHLGIGTITPSTALTIFHDQNQIIQINQTTATNDTKIAFQNSGTPLWRIGNSYGAGTNRFVITDATLNINRFSVLPSSGQTFVGDVVTSSGLFVVNSSSSDAHIVALGATAPSIRVRNAGTGASLQIGLGLATTTNNFIQGSVGGEFCIFNDSLTAQPILFGIKDAGSGNTLEAARISAARNFLVGTSVDAGFKLFVGGSIGNSLSIYVGDWTNRNSSIYLRRAAGGSTSNGIYFGLGASSDGNRGSILYNDGTNFLTINSPYNNGTAAIVFEGNTNNIGFANQSGTVLSKFFGATGNLSLNSGTDAGFKLDVNGTARVQNDATFNRIANFVCPTITGGTTTFQVTSNGISFITVQENNRLTLGSAGTEIRIQGGQSINIGNSGLTFNAGNWVPSGATNLCGYIGNWTNPGSAGPNFGNVINLAVTTNHTTATNTLNQLSITPIINNTGGTNTNRGIFYNPTLTSLTGTTHNAIETVTGNLCFGTTSGNVLIGTATSGSSKLRIVGLPTSAAGLSSGDVWNNAGVLNIVP